MFLVHGWSVCRLILSFVCWLEQTDETTLACMLLFFPTIKAKNMKNTIYNVCVAIGVVTTNPVWLVVCYLLLYLDYTLQTNNKIHIQPAYYTKQSTDRQTGSQAGRPTDKNTTMANKPSTAHKSSLCSNQPTNVQKLNVFCAVRRCCRGRRLKNMETI